MFLKSNEMITSHKESNIEKEFNENPMKDDHPKRHHTYIYWHEYPLFCSRDSNDRTSLVH